MSIETANYLPVIILKGSPEEIGLQHGRQLRDRIVQCFQFYKTLFGRPEEEIFRYADHFRQRIREFNPIYEQEILAIANGAELDPRIIFVLNSRTEIFHKVKQNAPGECTSLYFPQTKILGQNWDWARALEPLIVLLSIEHSDGRKVITMTEPGIIGKVGMNSNGIGVCLNILRGNEECEGVPVHILLRAALDSATIDEALATIAGCNCGTMSHILLADHSGKGFIVEIKGKSIKLQESKGNQVQAHTNHYTMMSDESDAELLEDSQCRLERAMQLSASNSSNNAAFMKKILFDRANDFNPVCRLYEPHLDLGELGTLTTIIMHLRERKMEISSVPPATVEGTRSEIEFREISFESDC